MRKTRLLMLCLTIIFLTGCSFGPISNNLNENIRMVLNNPMQHQNQVSIGYKYYLPYGYNLIMDNKNNKTIYNEGNSLYIYVDTVSYYYKYQNDYDYVLNERAYVSRKLDHDGIKGYIEVTKVSQDYLVTMVYNYAKLEAIVPLGQVDITIINGLNILCSIRYNDKVIASELASTNIFDKEETYQLYQPKDNAGSFLKYVETYDKYNDKNKELPDSDEIKVNKNTKRETD